jgi:hypothetical protein
MDLFQLLHDLKMLRAAFLTFPAFGTIRCPLLGGEHAIIKDEVDLRVLEHIEVIIQPKVLGNIDSLRAGYTIGTGRAINLQHFFIHLCYPIEQSQLFGGKGIRSGLSGDFDVLLVVNGVGPRYFADYTVLMSQR